MAILGAFALYDYLPITAVTAIPAEAAYATASRPETF
jgi:hypothetical protein